MHFTRFVVDSVISDDIMPFCALMMVLVRGFVIWNGGNQNINANWYVSFLYFSSPKYMWQLGA